MKIKFCISLITIFFIAFVIGCKPDPDFNPAKTEAFEFKVPKGWPKPFYDFSNNAVTREKFELGRKLFYDTRLSRDNTISCGSCHQQFAAFAQLDHDVSHGVDDKLGTRNSPPIFNLNWHTSFFWDGGVNHLESQPINPIQNPVEMDEKIENIIEKLKKDATYISMFKTAYGDETINSQRIFKTLAQFMGMMISSNSKYDKYVRGEAGGNMTNQELNGLAVFRAKCETCHKEPLFSDFSLRNNGLKPSAINDSGKAHITLNAADLYKFKVPSLRNLKYTAPYMHDGRFGTLEKVLDYYTKDVTVGPTLDPDMQGGNLQMTEQEKQDLLSFLNTLNDETFVKDSRFAEPN
jgi:cytochrome c peroxidase